MFFKSRVILRLNHDLNFNTESFFILHTAFISLYLSKTMDLKLYVGQKIILSNIFYANDSEYSLAIEWLTA